MASYKLLISSLFLLITLAAVVSKPAPALASAPAPAASNLFREYIGAEFKGVKFSDVPINPSVDFHFILSFAIDYTTSDKSPTNGDFNIFWDTDNLTPSDVATTKQSHGNVKVALSLGGDDAYFNASSIDSWVGNAVPSLTKIIKKFNLDGIDIYYRQFSSDPATFAECIGKLLTTLKNNGVISFASIAPLHYHEVQIQYLTLWEKYGDVIDYVNFQFYEFSPRLNVTKFLNNFDAQISNYNGGKVLVSFSTNASSGGLTPEHGFFTACDSLQQQGKLYGIFIWSADDSLSNGFLYEKQSQALLANFSST